MISGGVADLDVDCSGSMGGGLEEVVGGPPECVEGVGEIGGGHAAAEVDDAPCKHGGGEGHGEAELDVVAGVVVAAGEVHLQHNISQRSLTAKSNCLFLFRIFPLVFVAFFWRRFFYWQRKSI